MDATTTFAGLELVTSPFVMTPRKTSAGLVVCAVEHLEGKPGVVVDVGTGSGAIALPSQRPPRTQPYGRPTSAPLRSSWPR